MAEVSGMSPREHLLFNALQNVKVYKRIKPRALAMLLQTDRITTNEILHSLHRRMLITSNEDGTFSIRGGMEGAF